MTDKHRRFLGPVVEMRKLHDSAEQRIVHSAEMLDRKSLASVAAVRKNPVYRADGTGETGSRRVHILSGRTV